MPNQISIRGQVLMVPSKTPLANSKVELWDSSGPYGLIATINTDAAGNFTFLVSDPVAGLILQQSIVPQYKAYSGITLLASVTMAYSPEASVIININQGTYDAAIPDTEVSVTPINYITVQGTITDAAAKPSVNTTVNIYENGINNKYLLATVQTDAHGYYQAKISSRLINNTVVLTNRSIRVEALDPTGIFIASNDIFEWHDVLTVNLALNSVNALSEFENVRNAVTTVTAGLPISTLKVDTVNNIDQLRYVSGATSHKSSAVQNIVAAHKYADEHGQPPELFYALTKTTGSTVHPWLSMTVADIKSSVQTAAENGVMPASSLNNLSSFIQGAQAYQVTATQAIPIAGESHTLNDVLQAGLGSAANVSSFLTEYNNQDFDDISDFWISYTANHGAAATQTAQTTLQLAGLTCFQPLMLSALTSNLRGAHISQLSTWTTTQWLQFVQNVCSTNNTLAVPASIRGSITDPNNIDVQTQYAQTLADIAQKMYPLTNISSQLQGNNGPRLIQDNNARSQVITFIGNNPDFDPIKNSIHDISSPAYNFNLTGITDVNALASALKPFVTVSKITGGNPTATAAMIMNGHNSALAISQLSRDEFVSLYGSSFAPMSVAHNEEGMFVESHSGAPTPAMTTALTAHTTAAITTHYALHSLLSARNNLSLPANGALANFGGVIDTVAATADPDLATMFGSLDFCNCEMCSSLYSPSAYLADILNFLGKKASTPLVGGFTPAYNELVNRRPDIANIDLSCKNANTPVPYIDLVNELLELMILRQLPGGTVAALPSSFQTTGTQVELAAYPEHKYRLTGGTTYSDYNDFAYVYNNILNNAGYPYNLPFSLPIEETRSYLKYLGKSRYDMMRLFLPPSQQSNYAIPTSDVVSNYSIFTEWLGITQNAASIITATTGSSTPWLYYGLNHSDNTGGLQNGIQDPEDSSVILKGLWTTLLTSRIDVLLKQTGLSYEELLQFLNTSFLNNGNNITIAPHAGAPANTCQLNLLQLNFAGTATPAGFLGNLYRAILLYRTKKMDINKWDVLFRALNISALNQNDYQLLGRVMLLANRLGLAPEIVAGWWQNMDNVSYTDYNSDTLDIMPTVYGSIFGNKSIINDPANAIFSNPASLPSQYLNNTASIAGFCRIREDEVITILNFLGITNLSTTAITWIALSRLYIIAQVAKATGYSIQDFVTIMQLCQTHVYLSNPPYTVGSTTYQISDFLNNLQSVLDYIDTIKTSGFSVAEINYLIGNIDTENIYTPNVSSIQLFLEALRSELQKYPLYTGSNPTLLNQLINVVYQQFSKQFNVSSDWIASIINPGGTNTGVILEFINSIFVTSAYDLSETTIQYLDLQYPTLDSHGKITSGPYTGTELPGFLLSDFYLTYRRVYKVIYIANKLRLRNQEFEYFYLNPSRVTSAFSIFDFTLLQVAVDSNLNLLPAGSPASLLNGLLRLSLWAQVRNKLSLPEDGLGKLIDAAYTIVPANPGAAL
ncbi:MAG: Tc toxin subunit A, partial [Flavipsychrobacter sp.]